MKARALLLSAAFIVGATPLLGAASLPGIRASGTLVTQVSVSGTPVSLGGDISMYHKGAEYRLDVHDVRFPGADATTAALMQQFLPAGGISILYNGATGSAVAWSTAARSYYVIQSGMASNGPPSLLSSSAPSTPAAQGDPLAGIAAIASVMRDMETASVQLTGHRAINGHPTTDVDVQMRRQLPGKPAEDYHAQIAFADDLSGFPVQMTLQSIAPTSSGFGGTVKIDLTTVEQATPNDAVFVMPPGYTRVTGLQGLLGHGAP
jgi:hypothetical protein